VEAFHDLRSRAAGLSDAGALPCQKIPMRAGKYAVIGPAAWPCSWARHGLPAWRRR